MVETTQRIKSLSVIGGIRRIYSGATLRNTRRDILSDALIAGRTDSIICDGSELDDLIDEFGVWVIVRVATKTRSDDDSYNEAITITYKDTRVKAMCDYYFAESNEVKEGLFKAGEISFTLKNANENLAVADNIIMYNSKNYVIYHVERQPVADYTYRVVVRVRRT